MAGVGLAVVVAVVGDRADVEDVERHIRPARLDVNEAALAHGVADAQLVEDVGVVDAEVGDDQVRQQQLLEHVGQDVATDRLLVGPERLEAGLPESGPYELLIDTVEVYPVAIGRLLAAERHDDERVRQPLAGSRSVLLDRDVLRLRP